MNSGIVAETRHAPQHMLGNMAADVVPPKRIVADFKWKVPFLHQLWNVRRGPELFPSNRPSLSFFRPLTSQPNQEFCWQWNILNLTTPRKTFWRIAFYFGWPNCTLPMAAPCAVSHSLLKQLHFYIQIIHHCLDLFPPFFTFHTFGVLCGDLRWGGRKKVLLCFFFRELLLKHLKSLVYGRSWSDRQGCPIYSQIKKNHTGRQY